MPQTTSSNHPSVANHIAVDQVMGNPPNWIIYWGITAISIFLMVSLGIAALVSYPDTLNTSATIYLNTIPVEVANPETDIIQEILVHENQMITSGTPLIALASTGQWRTILTLDSLLRFQRHLLSASLIPAELGSLGDAYQQLILLEQKINYYKKADITPTEVKGLQTEISDYNTLYKVLMQQKEILIQEVNNLSKRIDRNKILLEEGSIALQTFEDQENNYLQKKRNLKNIEERLINTDISRKKLQLDILRLEKQDQDASLSLQQQYLQQKSLLQSNLQMWKKRYLLTAPSSGKITFAKPVIQGSLVEANSVLLSILPNQNQEQSFLQAALNAQGIGKLEVGQTALVSLDGYPASDYGVLKATVEKIAPIPHNKQYYIYLSLPQNWITSYGIEIPKQTNMAAQISIQTKQYTLLERIFSGFLTAINQ